MSIRSQLKAKLATSGIAKKFLAYLMVFSVLPLIIIGAASYQLSTDTITNQAKKFAQEAIYHQRDTLDIKLQRVEDLITDISGVEEIIRTLSKKIETINTYTELATKARIGYILNGYLSLGGLLSIDIYTLDGAHYHVGETLDTEEQREDVRSKLFKEAQQNEQFVYWAGIEENINKRSPNQQVLSAISIFTEIDRKTLEQRSVAMLVANYSLDDFNGTVRTPAKQGAAYFVILDKKNRIILHPNKDLIGRYSGPQLEKIIQIGQSDEPVEFFGEDMVVNRAYFDRNGWKIASFIPVAILTKPASDIGIYTIAILALCLFVISIMAVRYSKNVVEPIKRVIEAFKAFEKGTLDPTERITVSGDDEIAELSKWYNSFLTAVREQRETQSALVESENRFKDFAEATSDWFWETDVNHKFTYISDLFFEYVDIKREDIYGRSRIALSNTFKDPVDLIEWDRHLLDLEAHKSFRVNYPLVDENGKVFFVQSSGKPVFDKEGTFLGYRGTGTDISKEMEAEKALLDLNKTLEKRVNERTTDLQDERDRAERLVNAIDTLNEAVAIFDEEDRFIFCNKEFSKIKKKAPEAIEYGTSFENYMRIMMDHQMLPEAIGREDEWLKRRMQRHKVPKGMFEEAWSDGRWLLVHEQGLIGGGTIIMSTDITERKLLEEQVRRSQKMDAVGQLTGGVAHDFNNILGIIQGNLELLAEGMMEKTQVKLLKSAEKGIERGADITRKLLAFSRKDVRKVDTADANILIENLEGLIARSLTAYIRVETHLAGNLWPVKIDTGDFEDALLNLSINAKDAMPDGGLLIIETLNKTLDDDFVYLNPHGQTGDFVMISVSDTGVGMDEEIKEKLFEPFFTTKDPGKGTGLGLSMVYGFAQRSGGHLQIYSEKGEGTTIRLFLPRAVDRELKFDQKKSKATTLPQGTETILVVDDEQELREISASHIRSLGYTSVEAENGDIALALLNQRDDIDLMFSDVVMPGNLDGYQLAKKSRKLRPGIKILLTSGYTKSLEDVTGDEGPYVSELVKQLLSKPFNKRELAMAIRRKLDEED